MPSPIGLEKAPPRAVLRFGLALRRLLHRAGEALVPPEVRAYELSTSFFVTRVAGALVELGVIDALGSERRSADPLVAGVDMHMLAECDGGRQRSAAELQALLREAGLRPGEVRRAGPVGFVEGAAAGAAA